MSASNQSPTSPPPAAQHNQPPAGAGAKDPLLGLVETLNQRRGLIAGADPQLSRTIEALAAAAKQPGRTADVEFRTRVAYAVQDMSRLVGPTVAMPEPLREEMNRLAVSAPALRNSRLTQMLLDTPSIDDRKLVRDIREAAFQVAKAGGDQNGPDAARRVDALEDRFRRAVSSKVVQQSSPTQEHAQSSERVHAAASPGEGSRPTAPASAVAASAGAAAVAGRAPDQVAAIVRSAGLLDHLVSSYLPTPRETSQPEPRPTPISERILAFTRNHLDQRALETAEASGQRATEALQAFIRGPGAGVLARIQDAAKSEPAGIQGVLAEMREGGRHAELRTQFNAALQREQGLAAAYDKAAAAVRQYGTDRQAAEAVVLKRPNDAALAGRFERLDAQIGEATSQVPGRQDLVRRAVDAVRSVFSREVRVSSSPSPSASP